MVLIQPAATRQRGMTVHGGTGQCASGLDIVCHDTRTYFEIQATIWTSLSLGLTGFAKVA